MGRGIASLSSSRLGAPGTSRAGNESEILLGVALILQLMTRTSLVAALALVVNYHITNGKIFPIEFFSDPHPLLLLASLLMLLQSNASAMVHSMQQNEKGRKKEV